MLTLGPPEAEEQLRDAMAIGADRAILLETDGADWDPEATAAALVEVIRPRAPDLVIFGNESADSGGFQVGIRVAHALGRPIVTGLKAIAVEDGARALRAGGRLGARRLPRAAAGRRDGQGGDQPAALPVGAGEAAGAPQADRPAAAGGRPRRGWRWCGWSCPRARASRPRCSARGRAPRPRSSSCSSGWGSREHARLHRGRRRARAAGAELRARVRRGVEAIAVRLGAGRCTGVRHAARGGDRRLCARRRGRARSPRCRPTTVVAAGHRPRQRGARARGGDDRRRVRRQRDRGASGDEVTRQRWGGSAARGGAAARRREADDRRAARGGDRGGRRRRRPCETFTPRAASRRGPGRARGRARRGASTGGVSLADAPVVVSGGRGVGSAEGFAPIEELAGLLGGVVGCSRAVTMAGWRPHTDQVGQTGTKISPDLYIPCGISGATQHMAGCKGAKKLLAINSDPEAPIMASADYAVDRRRAGDRAGDHRRAAPGARRVIASAIALAAAIAVAGTLFARRALLLDPARPDGRGRRASTRADDVPDRLRAEAVVVVGQRKLLQRLIPGLMHAFIFWAFIVLFPAIFIAMIEIVDPDSAPDWALVRRAVGRLLRARADRRRDRVLHPQGRPAAPVRGQPPRRGGPDPAVDRRHRRRRCCSCTRPTSACSRGRTCC